MSKFSASQVAEFISNKISGAAVSVVALAAIADDSEACLVEGMALAHKHLDAFANAASEAAKEKGMWHGKDETSPPGGEV